MNTATPSYAPTKPATGWTYEVRAYQGSGIFEVIEIGLNRATARTLKNSLKASGKVGVYIVREQDGVTIR